MLLKTLGFNVLLLGAISAPVLHSTAHAQAFSPGVDKPVPRFCNNSCVQSNEQMVVDGSGNTVAMWNEPFYQDGETFNALIGARYSVSSNSWSVPTRLMRLYGGTPHGKLAIDSAGNATMMFPVNAAGYSYTDYDVLAAKWVAGYGWRVDTAVTEYGWAAVSPVTSSVGRNGHIFVSYGVQEDTVNYSGGDMKSASRTLIYSSMTKTWTSVFGGPGEQFDRVVADPNGSAVGFAHANGQIWSKRFDTGTRSWVGLADTIESAGSFNITQFQAVSDRSGNIMIIYEKFNYTTNTRELKSARYQASTRRWTAKSLPKISSSRLYGVLSLASDRYGNFYATWVQYSSSYIKTISARYSSSGGAWSQPVVVSRGSYHTRNAAVTTDYAGNAIYTWSQRADTGTASSTGAVYRTMAVRYSNAVFGTPKVIQDAYRNGYKPYIGADNSGRAIVMWTQNSSISGVKEIRSDRLLPQ